MNNTLINKWIERSKKIGPHPPCISPYPGAKYPPCHEGGCSSCFFYETLSADGLWNPTSDCRQSAQALYDKFNHQLSREKINLI